MTSYKLSAEDKMMHLMSDPDARDKFYQAKQHQEQTQEQKRAKVLDEYIRETEKKPISNDDLDLSEDAIALLFAEHNTSFRWIDVWGKWYVWNGKVWEQDHILNVYDRVRKLLRAIAENAEKKYVRALKKANTVAAIERLARSDRRLIATHDQWDSDVWLLNTQGGIVDLLSGEINVHEPMKYMTHITRNAPGGDCPRWLQFLREVTNENQGLVDFLQRVIGYCLSGSVNEHALFFLYGTGRNGKGVFLNTLDALLGEYSGVASIETLMEAKGDRHPTELAMLQGKRLVIAQEVDEGGRWAESKIKMLTGGDPVTARYMRQDFFTYNPQFKLVIAGNHKPAFRNVDEALRARLHLIPFTVTIPKDKRDPDLQIKLKDEWAGILQWAIDGAVAYQKEGLNPPEAVTNATAAYFEDEDIFKQWIEERCKVGVECEDTPTRLFNSWRQFAQNANYDTGDNKKMKSRLEAIGYIQRRTKTKGRFYAGIRAQYLSY